MGGDYQNESCGLKLLVEKYRKEFQIPENLNFYSEKNYKIAERKYLKYTLGMGGVKIFRNNQFIEVKQQEKGGDYFC
jgi:hypothetical protein